MGGPSAASDRRQKSVREFYTRCLDEEEDDARRVSWHGRYDQEYRLHVLLEVLGPDCRGVTGGSRGRAGVGENGGGEGGQGNGDGDGDAGAVGGGDRPTLLDVGCGLGALVDVLERSGLRVDYLGVDLLPEMVEGARARHPGWRFLCADILEAPPPPGVFDYVLCSGTLTVRTGPDHRTFVRAMVRTMYRLARRAVAFNLLTTRGCPTGQTRGTDFFRADPLEWYRLCREMCPRTVLREDFLPSDFAILMFKGPPPSVDSYASLLRDGTEQGKARGLLHQEQGLHHDALRALEAAPATADILNLRAVSHLHLGDAAAGELLAREALDLDPDHVAARFNLGVALEKQGRMDSACALYREVLESCPDHREARRRLARPEFSRGTHWP